MPDGKIGVTWALGMTILVLTLAVWMFFYFERMALDAGGTAVVAMMVTLAVVAGRFAWSRLRKSKVAATPEVKR